MSMTQLLFSFQGRLNRKPYWLTNIAVVIGIIILVVLALVMVGERRFAEAFLTIAILVILYIPLFWVSLALGAKRLHDRDKSAWWLLLFYIAPEVASGISATRWTTWAWSCIWSASLSLSGPLSNSASCAAPVGPNRYGPDPLAPAVLGPPGIVGQAHCTRALSSPFFLFPFFFARSLLSALLLASATCCAAPR